MKKLILVLFVLTLMPTTSLADGWLYLFTDEDRVLDCINPPSEQYVPIDVYLFAIPPAAGLKATECKIVMPDPCGSLVLEEYHPDVDEYVLLGEWETGMSVSFSVCQTDPWVLVCHLRYLSLNCAWGSCCRVIVLGPHDGSGLLGGATCEQGFPLFEAEHGSDVYVNCQACPKLMPDVGEIRWANPISYTEVEAHINEDIIGGPVEDVSNYTIYYNDSSCEEPLYVTNATLLEDSRTIRLTLSDSIAADTEYLLRIGTLSFPDYFFGSYMFAPFAISRDLIVPWIGMRPSEYRNGCTPLTISFEVRNQGMIGTDPFQTLIYLHTYRYPRGDSIFLDVLNCPGLPPHSSYIDSITVTFPSDDSNYDRIFVHADENNWVEEINTDNNLLNYWFGPDYYVPKILSIEDVPDDQGGFVEVEFSKSPVEQSSGGLPVHRYDIFRRNDPEGTDWENVGWVPAEALETYSTIVPTLGDSSGGGIAWAVYRVRVLRTSPDTGDTLYDYSCSDSGYSVDNTQIATLLQQFDARCKGEAVEVSWMLADNADGTRFSIHRQNGTQEYMWLSDAHIESDGPSYTYLDRSIEPGERYRYRVFYQDGGEQQLLFETDEITIPGLPLTLYQNYPNPFNPSTSIRYYLPVESHVELGVFDVSGMKVTSLIQEKQSRGFWTVVWDGTNDKGERVSSGIYFYRLRAGKEVLCRKMILLE